MRGAASVEQVCARVGGHGAMELHPDTVKSYPGSLEIEKYVTNKSRLQSMLSTS